MRHFLNVLVSFLIMFTVMTFTGCDKGDSVANINTDKIKQILLPNEKNNAVNLDLYFDSSKSEDTPEISKEQRLIQKDEIIGELIMQELIKGPSVNGSMKSILPKATRLLSFSIKDGIAYVNLSSSAKIKMSPAKEQSCIKSIVWSLTQISSISKVKILVESKDVDSLGGNINLSNPIGRDNFQNAK